MAEEQRPAAIAAMNQAPFRVVVLSRTAEMAAAASRAGILDGLRAVLLELSRERPLVIVVEDLHWIDEASETAIAALADLAATVINFRDWVAAMEKLSSVSNDVATAHIRPRPPYHILYALDEEKYIFPNSEH